MVTEKCERKKKFVCECRGKPCTKLDETFVFKHYEFVEKKMSWFDAKKNCRKTGMDLASVRSKEELERLKYETPQDKVAKFDIWIGLNDRYHENQFVSFLNY